MATQSFTDIGLRGGKAPKGFFRTTLDRIVEARQRQVKRQIIRTLSHMDDDQLARIGFDRASLFDPGSPRSR